MDPGGVVMDPGGVVMDPGGGAIIPGEGTSGFSTIAGFNSSRSCSAESDFNPARFW